MLLLVPFVLAACDSGATTSPQQKGTVVVGRNFASAAAPTCTIEGKTYTRGYNDFGYNYCARNFNGTGTSWSLAKGLPTDYLGVYANDKLIMKWNAEWDRGNAEGWSDPNGYAAWEDNEWNGKTPGGSGQIWHYKIKWDATCAAGETPTDGGYCIWGVFEVVMDQGIDPNLELGPGHLWFAHAKPNGYGN